MARTMEIWACKISNKPGWPKHRRISWLWNSLNLINFLSSSPEFLPFRGPWLILQINHCWDWPETWCRSPFWYSPSLTDLWSSSTEKNPAIIGLKYFQQLSIFDKKLMVGMLKLLESTQAYRMDMLWYSTGLMSLSVMLLWISIISWLLICQVASSHLHWHSGQIDLWHGGWIHGTTCNAWVDFGHALLSSHHFLASDYQVSHFQENCLLDWCQTWWLNCIQGFVWLISI